MAFLSGGEQTTINSTITELYPALAFNNNKKFTSPDKLNEFVLELLNKNKLFTGQSKKSFVNKGDADSAIVLISDSLKLRPAMRNEKLNNAIGILNYLYEQHSIRKIEKVVWGYRAKPPGVPNNHAGDIFLIYSQKRKPKVLGVSLKAGTKKSAEPKLNSYVRTTLTKPYWLRSAPNAQNELKRNLWNQVYSNLYKLNKKIAQESTYLDIQGKNQKPNEEVVNSVLRTFKHKKQLFEDLYIKQNLESRKILVKIINKDFKTALEWIENEFRLEKPASEVEVPLVLVKAVGNTATEQGDKLAKIFPKITKIKAYLNTSSVQEWFIDVFAGKQKLTLLMTIRSDSEYRESKQKGKLGAYMQLKLLYRGYK
tara:strand:- start:731 stop:1834 length:1104 start_codon:yes stop_codon:yes gene_type:complete